MQRSHKLERVKTISRGMPDVPVVCSCLVPERVDASLHVIYTFWTDRLLADA
jgi:hypothetical protein